MRASGAPVTEAEIFGNAPLAGLSGSINDPGIINNLQANAAAGRRQLDDQHYSSRGMPSEMMSQGLSGLLSLTGQSQGAIGAGMNQFYDAQQGAGESADGRFNALQSDLLAGLSGTQGAMGRGFDVAGNQIQGMWDNSLGRLPGYLNPSMQVQQERDAQLLRAMHRQEDSALRMGSLALDPSYPTNSRTSYEAAARRAQTTRDRLAAMRGTA